MSNYVNGVNFRLCQVILNATLERAELNATLERAADCLRGAGYSLDVRAGMDCRQGVRCHNVSVYDQGAPFGILKLVKRDNRLVGASFK